MYVMISTLNTHMQYCGLLLSLSEGNCEDDEDE